MRRKILLTSFTTWKPEQPSNASDDLLALMQPRFPETVHMLRQLPVDFELAPQQVIAHVERLQPEVVVCCGMAETRDRLNLEAQAIHSEQTLKTTLDLVWLSQGLRFTDISHDAGRFVCNHTYFALLKHLQNHAKTIHALFIHVPVLTTANQTRVLQDFETILYRLHRPLKHRELDCLAT